jgi:hypothetical protein
VIRVGSSVVLPTVGAGYEGRLRTQRQALAERFCFWRGVSGSRYVCSVFSPGAVPPFSPAVALHVRRGRRGPELVAVTAGADVDPQSGADEVHLHLVRGGADAQARALRDFRGLIEIRPNVIELRAA